MRCHATTCSDGELIDDHETLLAKISQSSNRKKRILPGGLDEDVIR